MKKCNVHVSALVLHDVRVMEALRTSSSIFCPSIILYDIVARINGTFSLYQS